MLLKRVRIYNYRNFEEIDVPFVSFSSLVGPNNIGKSSILQALEYIFTTSSPRNVPITKADFHDPSKEIVVEAVLGDLNTEDKDVFFHDDGLVNLVSNTITIRFVSSWSSFDQDVENECYFVRDDRPLEDQQSSNYTNRYKKYVPYFVISSERSAEREIGVSKWKDLGKILRMYSSDYLKPLPTLIAEIQNAIKSIEREKNNWNEFPIEIFSQVKATLNDVLKEIPPDFLQQIKEKDPKNVDNTLENLEEQWAIEDKKLQNVITENPDAVFLKNILQILERVPILIKRAKTQNSLYELQHGMLEEQKFEEMHLGMKRIFDMMLPDQYVNINLFSIQDDELISQMAVNLDERSVLNAGSGFQSMFVIGLKLVRMLAQLENSNETDIRTFVVGVEEPENYLHPHMQRHLVKFLRNLQNMWGEKGYRLQIIITTHSPSVLSRFSIEEVVLLKKQKGMVNVSNWREGKLEKLATDLEPDEKKRGKSRSLIKKHLEMLLSIYAEAFFSSLVVIVEGETELGAIPVWGEKIGLDFDFQGISVLLFKRSSMKFGSLFLKEFDIEHVIVYDSGDGHSFLGVPSELQFSSGNSAFEKTIMEFTSEQKLIEALITRDPISTNEFRTKDISGNIDGFENVTSFEEIIVLLNGNSISSTVRNKFRKRLLKWLKQSKGIMLGKIIAQNTEKEEIPLYILDMFTYISEYFSSIKEKNNA